VAQRPALVEQWETARMAWLDPDDVVALPLHPAFRDAWDDLRAILQPLPSPSPDRLEDVGGPA
jgi:hypothetical protein